MTSDRLTTGGGTARPLHVFAFEVRIRGEVRPFTRCARTIIDAVTSCTAAVVREDPNGMIVSVRDQGPYSPHVALRDAVRRALDDYDTTNDHTAHALGADCLRCRLAAVIANR